jgi:hypothetical protein
LRSIRRSPEQGGSKRYLVRVENVKAGGVGIPLGFALGL